MRKLSVLLVDDEIMIREGFKRLFDWEARRYLMKSYKRKYAYLDLAVRLKV